MIISVHQPQYLPWIGYFDKIDKSDCFVFLDTVQYKAREYQNRNRIRIKGKWIWLTVPVKASGSSHPSIAQVEIDNETDWAQEHKKSLQVWYAKTEYFRKYFPFFDEVYSRKWERLADLNIQITRYLLEQLGIKTPVKFESELGTTKMSTDRIVEICKDLKADAYLSGVGGKDYLEENKFSESGIKLYYQEFTHPIYRQLYSPDESSFEKFMSVIDLLFNEGPKSLEIIRQGRKNLK